MEKKTSSKSIISSSAIQQINEATIVMRHFIDLSAKLLPFFHELTQKKVLSPQEEADRNKIKEVYRSYGFDTTTSLILMESDILETIQDTFSAIEKSSSDTSIDSSQLLTIFEQKHQQLVNEWIKTDMN